MTKEKETNIRETIQILMQLDKKSLLLINSGAKLLAARQEIEKTDSNNEELQGA